MAASVSLLSGCLFTQWTDRAFLGSPHDPPAHPDAQWAGAFILPLAIVGDIVTAPGQIIALWIEGDWGPYHLPPKGEPGDSGYSRIDASTLRVATVDGSERPTEIELTEQQRTALAARLEARGIGGPVATN